MRVEQRVGIDAVEAMTAHLQQVRLADPTFGLYEAAEMQWWWGHRRRTDDFPQLFLHDDADRTVAAVYTNDFGDGSSAVYEAPVMLVSVLPDVAPETIDDVVRRGLQHLAEHGIDRVELEVGQADEFMRQILSDRGFAVRDDGIIEAWLEAGDRPAVTELHADYRLASRADVLAATPAPADPPPHHMFDERRPDIEQRLQQTSLYRADLDLVVLDAEDQPAAHGLFWFDPVTRVGVVEPMRTHEAHRQRGLARHVLTSGIDRLVAAGAERISIGWEPGNPASGPLYLSVGFEPYLQTDMMAGPTVPDTTAAG